MCDSPIRTRLTIYGFVRLHLCSRAINLSHHAKRPCVFIGLFPAGLRALIEDYTPRHRQLRDGHVAVTTSTNAVLNIRRTYPGTPVIWIQPAYARSNQRRELKLQKVLKSFPGVSRLDCLTPLVYDWRSGLREQVLLEYHRHPLCTRLKNMNQKNTTIDEEGTIYIQECIDGNTKELDREVFLQHREFLQKVRMPLSRCLRKVGIWAVFSSCANLLLWFKRDMNRLYRSRIVFRTCHDPPIHTRTYVQFFLIKDRDAAYLPGSSIRNESFDGLIHLDYWPGCERYRGFRVSQIQSEDSWLPCAPITGWAEMNVKNDCLLFHEMKGAWYSSLCGKKAGCTKTAAFYRRYRVFSSFI
ncbi:MAG: hypothetical protein CR997_00775 [Acidobacteria bacterium]|nr:MAG: hypothetical protein CR997_00775 [Acidobacteriota bacterium]